MIKSIRYIAFLTFSVFAYVTLAMMGHSPDVYKSIRSGETGK